MQKSVREVILQLLQERGRGKTICPSEAARIMVGSDARPDWEPQMAVVRQAAAQMAAAGEVEFTQKGKRVEWESAKGPVRLRLKT